jgi:hypothetical protein
VFPRPLQLPLSAAALQVISSPISALQLPVHSGLTQVVSSHGHSSSRAHRNTSRSAASHVHAFHDSLGKTWDKLSSVPDFCPQFEIGHNQFLSHSSVGVSFFRTVQYRSCAVIQIGGGHRGCSADGEKVCAHHCGARPVLTAPHSLERHGDATNALSLLARARTTEPRDARARNSLIAICAAGGPRSADIGRGPRAGLARREHCFPNAATGFIMASPPRSASETMTKCVKPLRHLATSSTK